jgi:hypothetical protein
MKFMPRPYQRLADKLKGEKAPGAPPGASKSQGRPDGQKKKDRKPQGKPKRPALFHEKFRLPDGAAFTANYNASTGQWTVSLAMLFPHVYNRTVVVKGVHHGLKLLGQAWFDEQKTKAGQVLTQEPEVTAVKDGEVKL